MSRPTSIVTGASGGIGRALVSALVRRGEHVLATDREAPSDPSWPESLVEGQALDVTDPIAWEQAIDHVCERWGAIDRVYHVAGVLIPGPFVEAGVGQVALHLRVNLEGALLGTQLAVTRMKARGRGHVIAVASLAALAPIPGLALYSASKAGLRAGLLAAADELRPFGVAVTVVCPDAVQTPMLEKQIDSEAAALTFSGDAEVLTPDQVAAVLAGPEVLERRPLELWLPRRRGMLAKFSDLAPRVGFAIGGLLRRRGRAAQARLREERG
ncbi:MAG: SDR family oxidoreductase [Planctomycetes bacterium]|nr:SDR family oxidoreductase [Planctomycetota bacterium]